ncbi:MULTISPECIES: haloacid dehalogenase type II [Halomonadaceae]|uniref:(S)-2-haloacid dehalogenase n=1 Tax=Vreelandella halophila TaxID=86177 RepID=A0A9X4Y9S6_9GAMM|nr:MULTISPECIES: haloacid dehalogenase type II [Halomonas]MYL25832.1 haloacid dehalogenase type II [Halomonas utahensis]MYL76106.1 haloacid dehalogenase type II [Halomonas sp. 22501_18_FS]
MAPVLAFDVYGTLVDPSGMVDHLRHYTGDDADAISALWRQKQVEYAFRRGLMRQYADFGTCTRQALEFAFRSKGHTLDTWTGDALLQAYQSLPAFSDAVRALAALKPHYRLFAFSNGTPDAVERVLRNAGVRDHLEGVVSVHELGTFKPDPAVYSHAREATAAGSDPLWLVSGNPWDVIGARSAGLGAAWVQRDPATVFDPWDIEPSLTVQNLEELAEKLPRDANHT